MTLLVDLESSPPPPQYKSSRYKSTNNFTGVASVCPRTSFIRLFYSLHNTVIQFVVVSFIIRIADIQPFHLILYIFIPISGVFRPKMYHLQVTVISSYNRMSHTALISTNRDIRISAKSRPNPKVFAISRA